jgi:hypothetical protein
MINFDDLPYAENPGSVTVTEAVVLTLASAAMTASNFFGYTKINPVVAVAPFVLLIVIMIAYRTIRNATHEALRLAASDAALDEHVLEQSRSAASRTLTPMVLRAQMDGAE